MADWQTNINVRIVSANPIIKLLNVIIAVVEFFAGIRRKGIMKDEKDHVVVETTDKVFWFFTKKTEVLKISKSRIAGIRVSKVKTFFIFRSVVCQLYVAGVTEQCAYGVKENYETLKERADGWVGT